MGAIGLNFGSPTSGTGFDVATTVAAITANLQATQTPYKNQLTSLQSEDAAISSLGTLMSTLTTAVQSFTSATGVLSAMVGSSSNSNVLELTSAGTGAVAGSHSIVVSRLAQTSSTYGSAVASTDTLSGSLSIQVGSATAIVVPVNSGENTLSGLAASINAANAGVTASVITGTGGQQLSLTSGTPGALGDLTVDASSLRDTTTSSAVTFASGQVGTDAQMTVDGIPATSSTNTVSGVLPGVTFQLLDASTTPVQVQIANNTSSVSQAVSTLVTDYNAVVSALATQEGNDTSGNAEPLFGNPLISTIQAQLDSAISGSQGSGSSAINLGTAGISINADGTLALDTDTLTTALNSNYNGIVSLFQDAGGAGQALSTAASELGSSQPNGVLTLAASENATEETSLNSTLATMTTTIAAQTAQLTASLNAANETLQLIPVQLSLVNELYSAISGYGTTNG